MLTLFVLTSCTSGQRPPVPQDRIVFSTGSPRGVYYAWGSALADVLSPRGVAVTVSASSGSLENLARVRSGEATMALATEDATVRAPDLVALARVYDDYLHVVVPAAGPVTSLADLAGRRVAIGSAGSGTALVADRLLTVAGLEVRRLPLDLAPALQALQSGDADAVFWSGGVPTASISELAGRLPIRLLSLDGVAAQLEADYDGVYRPATFPTGSYGAADPVAGLASANLLVARADTPADTVTTVLSAMFDQRTRLAARVPAARALDLRTAVFTGRMPLHPAAARYYVDAKP